MTQGHMLHEKVGAFIDLLKLFIKKKKKKTDTNKVPKLFPTFFYLEF